MEDNTVEETTIINNNSVIETMSDHDDVYLSRSLDVSCCRACLIEARAMKCLFNGDDKSSPADMLMLLANVKIVQGDGLPSHICHDCKDKLDFAYKFKSQVEKSDFVLRQKLDCLDVKENLSWNDVDLPDMKGNVQVIAQSNNLLNFQTEQVEEKIKECEIKELQVEKHDDIKDKPEQPMNREMLEVNNEMLQVSEQSQVRQESVENNQSFQELQEMMLNEIHHQDKMQEELNEIRHLAMNEHNYVNFQSSNNLKHNKNDRKKNEENLDNKLVADNVEVKEVDEHSTANETIRRSKRKLAQQKFQCTSSDEESYFENLNLSSRLKRVQIEKSEVFFICYWCDKQYLSREVLREHMYSHEEVRITLASKSVEKAQIHKTPEKTPSFTDSATPIRPPSSGKQANTCPHCGKEYLYINSYEKHLKLHKKEKKSFEDVSIPLEVTLREDASNVLDFKSYDDNHVADCDSENEEILIKEEVITDRTKSPSSMEEMNTNDLHNKKEVNKIVYSEQRETKHITDPLKLSMTVDEKSEPKQKVELNRIHKCPHCPNSFKHRIALISHLRCHKEPKKLSHKTKPLVNTTSKNYSCSECSKNFGNHLTLRNHLIATGHEKTVQKEQCDSSKRVKRVAAKAALKVIDKIKTDFEGSDEEIDKDDEKDADFNDVLEKVYIKMEHREDSPPELKKKRSKELFCAVCNKKCLSKQTLAKHMEQHSRDEKSVKQENAEADESKDDDDYSFDDWPMDSHECSTCKKKYSTKKSLLRHQLLHEDPHFECDICNVKFHRKDKLKAHYDKCSDKNPDQVRKCNICNDVFENNEMLKEHRMKHVDEGILTEEDLMEMDPKPEDKSEVNRITRKRRTDIVGLECVECNKLYSSRKGLLRHLQVHEGKKFLCDMCPKKFYRREHLKIHVARHNIVKPYKCSKCAKSFLKEDTLNDHMARHDIITKKPKDTTNDGTKRFLCEICSKSFTQSTTLVAHLRAHKGIKPYVCEVCSRPFTTNAYLKMHMRTHTQERPYICQYCSRAFARADTLANHLTSHTGEAKYHCKFCPKNFRRLKSLKEHVFIHTGQRPYACPTCDRKFNNNGSRYAHSKRCKQLRRQQDGQTTAQDLVDNSDDADEQAQIILRNEEPEEEDDEEVEEHEPQMAELHLLDQQSQVVQRIEAATTTTGRQIIKPENIKTITLARPIDANDLGQQHVVMPLILPFTVTLGESSDEVILSDETKIFTT